MRVPCAQSKRCHCQTSILTALETLALPTMGALTAIIRRGELLLPRADLVLQANDEVLAIIHTSPEGQLQALLGRDAEELERWAERILDMQHLEDLFTIE